MNIHQQDFRAGTVRIQVTDADDLWHLSQIIEPGDLVRGKTTRKIRIGEGENAKITKKTYTLTIEAETVELAGLSLRINGKIKEAPEELPKESYQAISLEEGSECTIQKKLWLSYQKQRLKEAAEQQSTYLLCLFDREEALFARTKPKGYELLVVLKGDVPKKGRDNAIQKDFQQELLQLLETYTQRYAPKGIILASPAFYKDDLFQKIKNKELREKTVLATCSDVQETSLDEVMKRPELKNLLKSSRARQEKVLVEDLLKEISRDGLAVYGIQETFRAIEQGAVSAVLLTEQLIKDMKEKGTYVQLDEKLKMVDSTQGEIHLISSEQDSGKRLDGLGGIAGLLRYKIH